MIKVIISAVIIGSLLIGIAYHEVNYGELSDEPMLNINYTGSIKGSCYYEGRSYGCKRNLSKLLIEDGDIND